MAEAEGFEIRNRPDWLYESLPYCYVTIGVVAAAAFGLTVSDGYGVGFAGFSAGNVIGMLSGTLFASAGIVVFIMRFTNRRDLAAVRAEIAEMENKDATRGE